MAHVSKKVGAYTGTVSFMRQIQFTNSHYKDAEVKSINLIKNLLQQPEIMCEFTIKFTMGKREQSNLFINFYTIKPEISFNLDTGLQIRVHIGKLFSLFLIQTFVVGTQKNRLNVGAFEYPNRMFKLMG